MISLGSNINPPGAPSSASPAAAPRAISPRKRQSQLLLCGVLWSVVFYVLISHYVLMAVEIKGNSMNPTLLDGDRYILYRCPYLWRAPRTGEIVVIKDPQDQDLSIKRIVALPNDLVEIRKDGVYVNNRKLPEPYLTSVATFASGLQPVKPIRLGPHEYFVLGDNRFRSADSRVYGPIQRDSILGLISKS